ncbi:hypothetical protein SNE26_23920 [Mucilaginibacter sp. cycad4]|uniref:hypothetical protein n=1 Tax=Mucilaginibacter sp. cycad4 TaxID=3342096 RepID=UPI002AAA82CF|nr:hypothetical protein [Mucilaginibacter gossypii]WPU99064.1 hypothetical protein SNE26_23920 [Mucilaginibacter gossypii]
METNKKIPKWVIAEAVTDCNDVHEFAQKYRKPKRFTGQGEAYVQVVMSSHLWDIERQGYTSISHHDNITGRMLNYIPKDSTRNPTELQDTNL